MNWKCPKCSGTNIRFMGSLTLSAPMKFQSNLTKRNLASKEVELWGFGWPFMEIYCKECGWTLHFGPKAVDLLYQDALNTICSLGGPGAEVARGALEQAKYLAEQEIDPESITHYVGKTRFVRGDSNDQ